MFPSIQCASRTCDARTESRNDRRWIAEAEWSERKYITDASLRQLGEARDRVDRVLWAQMVRVKKLGSNFGKSLTELGDMRRANGETRCLAVATELGEEFGHCFERT